MKRDKVVKDISIIGCITSTDRDEDNNARAVVISTDKEDYLVEAKGLGRDFLLMEGEEVAVKGKLIIDNSGDSRIRVSTYDLIDDTYYEENDFYYYNEGHDSYGFDFDDDSGEFLH